jgi:cell fate regulator YaaT (PSP1 superfamily)
MTTVVSVRFRGWGRSYYFDPAGIDLKTGDSVVVDTAKGEEFGEVVRGPSEVGDEAITPPLRSVIRLATDEDIEKVELHTQKEADAFKICEQKIKARKLEMKLVDVEYTFDDSKIIFYFTADGRVDFRELVRDLASTFHSRIELRQIGVRDESKMLGGLGICGRPFCCSQFLFDFQPVSIKTAKLQGISLNPTKISGACGRLMCCLKFENSTYEELAANSPRIGNHVETPDGEGTVVEVALIMGTVKVRLDADGPEGVPKTYPVDQLKWHRRSPQPQQKADGQPDDQPRRAKRQGSQGQKQRPQKKQPASSGESAAQEMQNDAGEHEIGPIEGFSESSSAGNEVKTPPAEEPPRPQEHQIGPIEL